MVLSVKHPQLLELWELYRTHGLLPPLGWVQIMDRLHEQLVLLDPGYELHEVKQKFGGLVVYAGFEPSVRVRCWEFIGQAMAGAAKTCERCGAGDAQLRCQRTYVQTLCDRCDALLGDD